MRLPVLPLLSSTNRASQGVAAAEEAFLTTFLLEVAPSVTLDGRPIGVGCPGPVTRRLQQACRKEVLEARGGG